ncbi:MAG: hypothetical protein MUO19_02570 [Dehalococcoidales bacterium]|nr:hypothetical protein [Dehalococcoidales bacterium]
MNESRYWKYFRTGPRQNLDLPDYRGNPSYSRESGLTRVVDLTSQMIDGAPNIGTTWFWPREGVSDRVGVEAHTHPFDEVIGFFGTNPEDQHDLGGEVELWLEDEKFVLTQSFITFIPAGMKHCPLVMRRVERPMFHFGVVPHGEEYV